MKTKLPGNILTALLSAATIGMAQAENSAYTGNVVVDKQFVVKKGEVNIGDDKTATDFSIQYSGNPDESFIVAGGGVLNVNNATISGIPEEKQMVVGDFHFKDDNGSVDGTVNVTNGSTVNLTNATTLIVGYCTNSNKSSGTINVDEASTFHAASNSLWLYSGTINVKNDSTFTTSTQTGNLTGVYGAYRTILAGYGQTANVNVENGSSFTSGASRFVSNFGFNTTVNISVSGKDENGNASTFTQLAQIPTGDTRTVTYLCDSGDKSDGEKMSEVNNCTTNISATDGGVVDFQSDTTYIGRSTDKNLGYTNKTATLTIGKGSRMSFKAMEIYSRTNIVNDGAFKATSITLGNGCNLTVASSTNPSAVTQIDELMILEGAELSNSGTMEGSIFMDGGTFTMEDGAVAGGLTATSGTIYLNGNVTFTGEVILGTAAISNYALMMLSGESDALTLYISQGATINADELTVGSGTNVAVVLNEGVIYEDGMELFTVTGNDAVKVESMQTSLGSNLSVYEYGKTEEGEASYTGNATGSIATAVVPEPTTATLSLLALAALAARRRRK